MRLYIFFGFLSKHYRLHGQRLINFFSFFSPQVTSVKKRKRTLATKSCSKTNYLLIALAVFILLIILYTSSVEEKTIEVKSKEDLPLARETLQQQIQKLDQRLGELRAFIT